MSEIFNPENKFFQGVGKLLDCVCLSLLWLVACVPIVTAGAATTALYYTVNKVIRYNRGYLWKEYRRAFCANFKQSTVVWLILLAAYFVTGTDAYVMYQFAAAGKSYGILYIAFLVFMAFLTMWAAYLFPYVARFEDGTRSVLKNCALLAVGNLGWTFLLFLLSVAEAAAILLLPPAVFLFPAVVTLLDNFILERIFARYMKPEDLAAEKERNREYYG